MNTPAEGLDLTAAYDAAATWYAEHIGQPDVRDEIVAKAWLTGVVEAAAPHVLRAAAEPIATTAAAHLAAMANPGDGQDILRDMARRAILRALGCTCRDHSDQGAVYAEDITCPVHGRALADEFGSVR